MPTKHPDKFYEHDGQNYTIIMMPSEMVFYSESYPVTHEDMLSGYVSDEDMEKLYKTYVEEFEELPNSPDDRYIFQEYSDGYLGRARVRSNNLTLLMWASKDMNMYSPDKITKIAEELAKYYKVEFLQIYVPNEVFSIETPRAFKQKIKYYTFDNSTGMAKEISKKEFTDKKLNEPQVNKQDVNEKKYEINGDKYSLKELGDRRKNLHLLGAKNIDSVLCAIDEKKYPELKGYKPMNCPSEKPLVMQPLRYALSRGPEDWRGQPINRLTSENYSFKKFLEKK